MICLKYKFTGIKEAKILIAGLDFSGKTTLVNLLKLGKVVQTIPTLFFNGEAIQIKNFSLMLWDIGGTDRIKSLIETKYTGFDGLIFVIDSSNNNKETLINAKTHLMIY